MTMLFTEPMDPGLASLLRFRKSIPPDIAKPAPYSLETGAQQLAQELGCKPCGLVRTALRRIGKRGYDLYDPRRAEVRS